MKFLVEIPDNDADIAAYFRTEEAAEAIKTRLSKLETEDSTLYLSRVGVTPLDDDPIKIVCRVFGGMLESVHVPQGVRASVELYDFDLDCGDEDSPDPEVLDAQHRDAIKGMEQVL